ncbi:MAG TPA: DUF192 domain-containing protein [Candidatus Paceibacterota bacterium]|nr:DUF192 domain-containing protein [Candidatus Paceibacterota bacterium]
MRRIPLPLIGLMAVAVVAGLLFIANYEERAAEEDAIEARVGGHTLYMLIADEADERTRGLSGRDGLEQDTGMLFIFDSDGRHGIWMKEMRFAIDILWLDRDGKVVFVREDIGPETYPTVFLPDVSARYVVEMVAGSVGRLGIQRGHSFDF